MAADVGGESGASVPAVVPAAAMPAEQPPAVDDAGTQPQKVPHRYRFLVVYAILGLALGAAAAGVAVFASRSISPAPRWSAWRPAGGGLGAEKQIADHVAGTYRLPTGQQLLDVIAKAPSVTPGKQTIPVHYLAIRGSNNGAVTADNIFAVSSSNSVMFTMCGLGSNCSIASGTPSVARGRLVRREILELALYTFKYVGGVDNVIAFMPPTPGATPKYVIYLRKADLTTELRVPLAETLRSKTPLPTTIPAHEVQLVDATTDSRLFSFSLAQGQQGDAILVLNPPPPA